MRYGSQLDPPNRFEKSRLQRELDQVQWDTEYLEQQQKHPVKYLADSTQSIVTENKSPDIPFSFSVNPYRGCSHGCAYCYARPTHEYLGLNAGLDFETQIIVKHDAPALLRDFLAKPSWKPETIAFSGVTDCYQPAEREFKLTRGCLEVALECRQPVGIVTKNALVVRDLDLIKELANLNLIHVFLSITTLKPELARVMEPRTSIPSARLRAISELSHAGVPTGVMTAPIIPGLNDSEVPEILRQASEAGASAAGFVMLRLPLSVEPVFIEWLERTQPDAAEKVLSRIRSTREGRLSESTFGQRMVGSGQIAEQIKAMFSMFAQKYGLVRKLPPKNKELFRPPLSPTGQMRLF